MDLLQGSILREGRKKIYFIVSRGLILYTCDVYTNFRAYVGDTFSRNGDLIEREKKRERFRLI